MLTHDLQKLETIVFMLTHGFQKLETTVFMTLTYFSIVYRCTLYGGVEESWSSSWYQG